MMTKSLYDMRHCLSGQTGGKAREILRAEMAKQNVTYSQLLERLQSIGVEEDERNLRNKVSRGKFTAAFMLQCLAALGTVHLHLG